MINIRKLNKSFDGNPALSEFDMTVRSGSIYGLVGTNGAGKTTVLKLINGVLKADSGAVLIDGRPVYENAAVKEKIAFIPDDLTFFFPYTLADAGRFFSELYRDWDGGLFDEIIGRFGLDRKRKMGKFSKGIRKQAVFALSFASVPDCLILDEPIDGLDPIVRRVVRKYIVDAAADRGMTTLISSHNLPEMEGFCDSVGVISKGRMVLEGELDELTTDIHKLQVSFGGPGKRPEDAYDRLDVKRLQSEGSVDHLIVRNNKEDLERFKNEKRPLLFDRLPLTLEEVFIYELGGGNDEIQDIL
ncbi:MAG: ABC transporter ATP-binding protein [Clostridiales Family XIII bacterium]|jgi:ABC-2 type transport system ATP-binding protein|nr:ABC transporter ATP-binding protein [Clostridiales Family XIII bacterium]